HRDEEEGGEGGTGPDQLVDAVRGVGGEVEGGEAHGDGALGGDAIRPLEVTGGREDEAEPDEHAETDPAGRPDPVPIERVAKEEADPEDQHRRPHPAQPGSPEPTLEGSDSPARLSPHR